MRIKPVMLLALLVPGLAVYTFVMIVPLVYSFYYSLTDWTGGPVKNFVGFDNYLMLAKDRLFWDSFVNNLTIMILTLIIQMGLAFLLTTLFMSKLMRIKEFHRTVIFFPVVLSAVVVGFIVHRHAARLRQRGVDRDVRAQLRHRINFQTVGGGEAIMSVRLLMGRTGGLLFNAIMLLFSLSCVYPIVWIIYSSLKSKEEFMLDSVALPGSLQFNNYYKAFVEGEMYKYFISSSLNSVATVIAVIVLSFCVAYALARFRFRGRGWGYTFFIAGLLIPVYGLIVPLFLQFKSLGLYDKFYTLILPYIAIRLPLPIFLLESYIRTIPKELDEAAYIDGASNFYTMTRILFPLCAPALSTVVILAFLDTWNEFPFSLVLVTNEAYKTLPVGLTNFYGQYTTDYTTLMAAMVLSILPVMLVYLVFYKNIIKGMTAGAVKG